MTKRKIVTLYPLPAASPLPGVSYPAYVYCVDDQGDTWFTSFSKGPPPAFADWEQLPELPEVKEPPSPTDEDLRSLYDWMANEWASNHDFELPIEQYAKAVLFKYKFH
jgi:hypothetical protein